MTTTRSALAGQSNAACRILRASDSPEPRTPPGRTRLLPAGASRVPGAHARVIEHSSTHFAIVSLQRGYGGTRPDASN